MQSETGKLGFVEDAAKRMHDTVNVLRDRAAQVEEGLRQGATSVEAGLRQDVVAVEGSLQQRATAVSGTLETANPELEAVQASIRSVLTYIRDNPVQAALLAIGAGVVATSMWNEQSERSGRRSRRRRQ